MVPGIQCNQMVSKDKEEEAAAGAMQGGLHTHSPSSARTKAGADVR